MENISIGKVCQLLGISLSTAYRWIKSGKVQQLGNALWKWCNPVKLKSNHEFDSLLKSMSQIVDRRMGRKFYLSDVVLQK